MFYGLEAIERRFFFLSYFFFSSAVAGILLLFPFFLVLAFVFSLLLFCVERLDLLCAGHQFLFFGLPPLCYSLRLKANRGVIFFSPWCARDSSIGGFIIDQPPWVGTKPRALFCPSSKYPTDHTYCPRFTTVDAKLCSRIHHLHLAAVGAGALAVSLLINLLESALSPELCSALRLSIQRITLTALISQP